MSKCTSYVPIHIITRDDIKVQVTNLSDVDGFDTPLVVQNTLCLIHITLPEEIYLNNNFEEMKNNIKIVELRENGNTTNIEYDLKCFKAPLLRVKFYSGSRPIKLYAFADEDVKYNNMKFALLNYIENNGSIRFIDGSIMSGHKDKTTLISRSVNAEETVAFQVFPQDGYTYTEPKIIKAHMGEDNPDVIVPFIRLPNNWYKFDMPRNDVALKIDFIENNLSKDYPGFFSDTTYINETKKKEEDIKEMNENGVVDYFEIPDELARELSNLLTKQTIREKLLLQLVDDPVKYEKAEELLIPVTSKIEAIKVKITKEYVPSKYNSVEYIWNYDGYEIDKNKVQILRGN